MQKKIEEQHKTIEFIKNTYKEKTGEEIIMPKTWQSLLDIQEDESPSHPLPNQKHVHLISRGVDLTFQLTIDTYNLPTRLSFNKVPLTSFSPANKFHMIECIDLSGFRYQGFSKNQLRDFVNRISQMRCLHMINLKDNNIGDDCAQQIEALLQIKRITRLDLSKNDLGKVCLQILTKNFNHLEWLDISRNNFIFEKGLLQSLLNSIRMNGKIFHLQVDLQDEKMMNTLCSYLRLKSQIHSIGPIDSKISNEAMEHICYVLESKESKRDAYRLSNLNFQFCYLDKQVFEMLLKSISANTTLIKLSLKANNLGNQSAINLCQILQHNISLIDLNLESNWLEDTFAHQLATTLHKNQILQKVNLSKNNISSEGASSLLKSLTEANDTIESFGDFQNNLRISAELCQKLKKALKINKVSKEIRSKLLNEEGDISISEVTNRQTQAFLEAQFAEYELLEPISVTNTLKDDPYQIHLWDFR